MSEVATTAVTKVLKPLDPVKIMFASKAELTTFTFRTRPGLCVEPTVTALLDGAVTAPDSTSVTFSKYELVAQATDASITSELEDRCLFKETKNGKELLKQTIASCILAQWEGKEGVLFKGYANIFYYERVDGVRFTLYISWSERLWKIYLFKNYEWLPGLFVFSRNTLP